MTPPDSLSVRVGLHKSYFGQASDKASLKAYHTRLIESLEKLDCADADTSNTDEKDAIRNLLEKKIGMERANRLVRGAILKAFEMRYTAKKDQLWLVSEVPNYGTKVERSGRADEISKLYREAIEKGMYQVNVEDCE